MTMWLKLARLEANDVERGGGLATAELGLPRHLGVHAGMLRACGCGADRTPPAPLHPCTPEWRGTGHYWTPGLSAERFGSAQRRGARGVGGSRERVSGYAIYEVQLTYIVLAYQHSDRNKRGFIVLRLL